MLYPRSTSEDEVVPGLMNQSPVLRLVRTPLPTFGKLLPFENAHLLDYTLDSQKRLFLLHGGKLS